MTNLSLLVCVASTLFMTGLIWFVQLVHYPLLGQVGVEAFARYHAFHTMATARIVIAPMLLQWVSSVTLAFSPTKGVGSILSWIGVGLATLCWLSTMTIQMPLHQRLRRTYDIRAIELLVSTNIIRTAAWTAHSIILLVILANSLEAT